MSSRELGRQTAELKVKLSEKLQKVRESWVLNFYLSQLLYGLVTALRTWLLFSAHRQVWRRKENFILMFLSTSGALAYHEDYVSLWPLSA